MDSKRFWQFFLIYCSDAIHMASISLVMGVQSNFCNRHFVIDRKLTIGLRSGEFLRQSNTYFCFLKIFFTFSDDRHGARSCWNFPPPSGNALLISGMTFFNYISVFVYVHLTLNWHKQTSKKLKLPQNIFFLGSFTTLLKWAGLNCSLFLILTNLLCFSWTKKWLSSKNSAFFRSSTVRYLILFCTF